MKHMLFILIILMGSIACSKKDDVPINNPELEGTWTGVTGFGSATPTGFERWILEADGDLSSETSQGVLIGTGSWTLDGEDFEGNYTPYGISFGLFYSGTYHAASKTIEGTWGYEPSDSDGGLFVMERD